MSVGHPGRKVNHASSNLSYGVIGKDILVPTLFDYVIIFSHSHKVENHKCILIQSPNAIKTYIPTLVFSTYYPFSVQINGGITQMIDSQFVLIFFDYLKSNIASKQGYMQSKIKFIIIKIMKEKKSKTNACY